ncbi:MAG: hypothetical protein AAGF77_14835, partial [Bacteroidota bacterium]
DQYIFIATMKQQQDSKHTAFFRTAIASCFASVSCALLASSLFSPSAAVAADLTLTDSDKDGKYEKVENLDIEGSLYDVEFVIGTPREVYDDGFGGFAFDFTTLGEAETALAALFAIDDFAFESTQSFNQIFAISDLNLYILTNDVAIAPGTPGGKYWFGGFAPSGMYLGEPGIANHWWDLDGGAEIYGTAVQLTIARFTQSGSAASPPATPASTPEPSLILGLMALVVCPINFDGLDKSLKV